MNLLRFILLILYSLLLHRRIDMMDLWRFFQKLTLQKSSGCWFLIIYTFIRWTTSNTPLDETFSSHLLDDSSDDNSYIEIIRSKETTGVDSTSSIKDYFDGNSSNELEFIPSSLKIWINLLIFLIISSFLDSSTNSSNILLSFELRIISDF